MDAQFVQLLMIFACVLGLYISRRQTRVGGSAGEAAIEHEAVGLEARRARDASKGLHDFVDEAGDILTLAREPRSDDETVARVLDDYHTRLVLFLVRNLNSYFARKIHHHEGSRRFKDAYPATLSAERLRVIRHLETDIVRLESFLSLVERPAPEHELRGRDEDSIAARYGDSAG